MQPSSDSIRVDKWLWAARVFKTRSLASTACDGGKVDINAEAAKPARRVRAGDRRGSAEAARKLFEDLTPPEPPRSRQAPPPFREPGAGRPTKRERREIDRLRRH